VHQDQQLVFDLGDRARKHGFYTFSIAPCGYLSSQSTAKIAKKK
jgi:hypothetical protein